MTLPARPTPATRSASVSALARGTLGRRRAAHQPIQKAAPTAMSTLLASRAPTRTKPTSWLGRPVGGRSSAPPPCGGRPGGIPTGASPPPPGVSGGGAVGNAGAAVGSFGVLDVPVGVGALGRGLVGAAVGGAAACSFSPSTVPVAPARSRPRPMRATAATARRRGDGRAPHSRSDSVAGASTTSSFQGVGERSPVAAAAEELGGLTGSVRDTDPRHDPPRRSCGEPWPFSPPSRCRRQAITRCTRARALSTPAAARASRRGVAASQRISAHGVRSVTPGAAGAARRPRPPARRAPGRRRPRAGPAPATARRRAAPAPGRAPPTR
jgi:hypothetical protein